MSNERDAAMAETIRNGSLGTSEIVAAVLAAGYRKPRTITTVEELKELPQGTKLYSPGTTHSWVLDDLSAHGGVKVHGTGGGYTYICDFMWQQAPMVVLCIPEED